jgi:uncharacterized membrane protein
MLNSLEFHYFMISFPDSKKRCSCSGAGAGAVVGGLVAGPLGAVLGAAIGTKAGSKNAKPAESELDQLLKEVDSEIAVAQANYEVSMHSERLQS